MAAGLALSGLPEFTLLVVAPFLNTNHALALNSPAASPDLLEPLAQREAPVASDEDAREHVDDFDGEGQKPVACLLDRQQDRLDVVLEEDSRDVELGDLVALLRHGVLVGEDRARRRVGLADRIHGWHHRHEVLELVKVRRGLVNGTVERVDEGREVGPEGELVDDV